MTFIYSTERRKFEQNWAKSEAFYRKHGMSESAIQEMREYDWDVFKAERVEALHTQEMGFQPDDDDDAGMLESPLMMKFFDQFTTEYDTHGWHERYWWLEELCDTRLAAGIAKLTDADKELLTLLVVEGYTQQECAIKMHMTQRNVGYKLHAIFGKFTEN